MTDHDLLARAEPLLALDPTNTYQLDPATRRLIADLVAALGARDTELATAVRERDSLARRCAVRFEESEKLRAELAAARAIINDTADAFLSFSDLSGLRLRARVWLASVSSPAADTEEP